MPGAGLSADFYQLTQQVCNNAGMPAYEISNHARLGEQSVHNLTYWRYGEYVGVGAGAHSRLLIDNVRHALAGEKQPAKWMALVASSGSGLVVDDRLTWEEEADEYLLMGMRLKEGISLERYHQLSGRELNPEQVGELTKIGFVQQLNNGNLRVSDKGWPVLDAVVADLAM